jgi:hypothetical protein
VYAELILSSHVLCDIYIYIYISLISSVFYFSNNIRLRIGITELMM